MNANPSQLVSIKSSSTTFVERDAAVVVDIINSGLRTVSGSLLVTHSQSR